MQIFGIVTKTHTIFALLTVILQLHCAIAQQQYSFRQLTVKNGLSQNSVVSIAQDSLGYLWLATQDGLNRYDGRSIKQYTFQFTDITRPNFSRLGKIYVDREGNIFIIPSDHMIYKYNRNEDKFLQVGSITNASTIWQDDSKKYWVGTIDGEIFTMEDDFSLTTSNVNTKLAGQIKKIGVESKDGQFILSEKSLILLNNKTRVYKEIFLETLLGEKMLTNLSNAVFDKNGKLWIGYHGDGIFYYDENTKSIRRLQYSNFEGYLPQDLTILDLFFDRVGRLWITTYGDGLYLVDFANGKIIHFSEKKEDPRALHYNDILCAFEDSSGTLWFGTDGAGASFYDADLEKFNSFTNYQTPSNINIDVVRALTVDKQENIWIGTSGKGLTKYEPATNSWVTYTTQNSDIASDRVMSLHHDVEGSLWIGTQSGGLSILDSNGSFKSFNTTSELTSPATTIWDILEDHGKKIWLATRDNGLIQFDKDLGLQKQHHEFKVGDSIVVRRNIRVLLEDSKHNLWIGTDEQGLIRFEPNSEKAIIYTTENSHLSSNKIKSIFLDERDILWIGTSGEGLDAYDIRNDEFYNFSTDDGLSNNVIYSILKDKSENLWMSSNKGITKFSLNKDFKSIPEITNYNNYDGLATEFNTGAYYKHRDGQLYFGGLDGFYWFDPQSISENKYLPETAITQFKVLNKTKSIYDGLPLKHNENTVDFTFSSLQFSEPEKNQYKYRLLPFEEDWVYSGNKNYVRYTRLPPNEYEFQVVSSNYDGKWNENPEKFAFTINAPWYFNVWSKSLYILLILLTALLVYRYLKWRWKMKLDLQLKEEEAVRFRELNEYKSKIYTEIAHEFRTPLTLISGPIESKLSEPGISEEESKKFTLIERSASRLTILVDQLLQLARLEEGKFQLKNKPGNLGLFLKALAASFEYEAEQKNIDYSYQIGDTPTVNYDEEALEKICSNLISNALKHGKKNGHCSFEGLFSEEKLTIVVTNDTDGQLLDRQQLFERFYQKDKTVTGAGIGLSLVQELVRLYKGEIKVDQHKKNIKFILTIPLQISKIDIPPSVAFKEAEEDFELENNQKPILLVAEDNKDVSDFIVSEFEKSFRILRAKNGVSGIKKAIKNVPDIIISDIKMPLKDGIELCNILKTDERTSHIPIILLTASTDRQSELKGLKAGADDYVTKPFKIKILEKRVDNLVKSRQLLRERYSQEGFLKPKDIAITPTDELFFENLQTVMDEHLGDSQFNAEKFSGLMGMSRMQLHRKLMTYTGLSTSAFIRSQRLKQAVQILKTSDATINEVAYTVGFNTPSYFIKCFKETYKKTPSEYFQSFR